MVFMKEDKVVIIFLTETKFYGAKHFLLEFPTKPWSLSGLKWLIKKIDNSGSTKQATGANRPCTVWCDDNIERVEQLALSQEDKPGTHSIEREIARELNISCMTVRRILHNDLCLKCFRKCWSTELSEVNKLARLQHAHQLLRRYLASLVNFIIFMDVKMFTVARPMKTQNNSICARHSTLMKQVPATWLLPTCPTFSRSLMVSVGMSALGRTSVHFVEPGVKVNGQYYRGILPDICQLSEFYIS